MSKSTNITGQSETVVTTENWWRGLDPDQRRFISNIAITLGISLIGAVLIYFGTKFIQNQFSDRELSKSFGDDKHAAWANQLHNAILNDGVWFGTDVPVIRRVLREVPSIQDFDKVEKSYKKQFKGAILAEDLRGDLSTTEYDEMTAIIDAKPEKAKDAKAGVAIYDPNGWAKRLNAAFNYSTWGFMWGTDEDAINAVVLEMPTQQAFVETAQVYENEYGVRLIDDWIGDSSPEDILMYMNIIKKKPKQ